MNNTRKGLYLAEKSPVHRIRVSNSWKKWAKLQGLASERPSSDFRKKCKEWRCEWSLNTSVDDVLTKLKMGFMRNMQVLDMYEDTKTGYALHLISLLDAKIGDFDPSDFHEIDEKSLETLIGLNNLLKVVDNGTLYYRSLAELSKD